MDVDSGREARPVIGCGQFEKAPEEISAIVPAYDRPRRIRKFGLDLTTADFDKLGVALDRITEAERAAWTEMGRPF